ncbi:hypothetical protein [Bradyrhizobium sp. HKCCYLR20261]|uniref:hypothetical protein n=1 Tax=unclassified Bradyrhizobium TaxID=2631580 RepID=UPI003EBFDADB
MAEVTNELIFGILKQIQQRLDRADHRFDEMRADLTALRSYQLSMMQDLQNAYAVLGRLDERFDRMERRLELSEAPSL